MLSLGKCAVAGAVVAFCTIAGAQQEAQQKGPCRQDAEKLCKDVKPGEGRLVDCLKSHKSELSPTCKSNLSQLQQALKQVSDACEPDVEKFCMNAPIGKGGLASCLKQHQADLSSECQGTIGKVKARSKPKQ